MNPSGEPSPERAPAIRTQDEMEKIQEVLRLFEKKRTELGVPVLDDEKVIAAAVAARKAEEREVPTFRAPGEDELRQAA